MQMIKMQNTLKEVTRTHTKNKGEISAWESECQPVKKKRENLLKYVIRNFKLKCAKVPQHFSLSHCHLAYGYDRLHFILVNANALQSL